MKKLIYFVSYGPEYAEMLHRCIDSLFPHIDETYRILVVADRFEKEGVKVMEFWNTDGTRHRALRRSNIEQLTDLYPYDFVYYFDHDIIFHRDLNELPADPEKVILCRELSLKMNSNQTNLLRSEIEHVGHELSINNGTVIVPKKYFSTFFKAWQDHIDWYSWGYNSDWSKHWSAQAAINKMYANKICDFGFIEEFQVHWPADTHNSFKTDRTVFSHYAGMTMEQRNELMKP